MLYYITSYEEEYSTPKRTKLAELGLAAGARSLDEASIIGVYYYYDYD